ncbi:MAG: lipopolysaccharide heptosyltransferase I [Methylomonas sp.]|nr:lipopolysaccharide heptosyltransferase I [Methylomonas sp.]
MKIASVNLSALGDIVHAMVALQFIKAAHPDAEIDWVVEERFADVLADNPDIRQILTLNLKALKSQKLGVFNEIARIRRYAERDYDSVIDAQGLVKSAIVARMLARHCAGFDQDSIREKAAAWFYQHTVACSYDANTIDRNVRVMTEPLGLAVSREQILGKKPFLFFRAPHLELDMYFGGGQHSILFVIGSTWPSRNYPKEKYLEVIRRLKARSLIAWGNEQEKAAAEWIARRSDAVVLPRLDLNDLKAVIARVDLVIGNDTGPTHMAWGLNRPSITLFGPTPVSRVYQTDINRVLKSPSVVNPYKLDKNDFSIRDIAESAVAELAESLLKSGAA